MPTGFELIKQQVETKKLGEELPIVGWFHFPLADPVANDFYAETVNTATAGHWDLIKIMTCGNYMPVAYGADYEFSTNPQKWDGVFHSHPITSAEDAGKLGVLDATNDTLAAEVAVDGRIVDTYKGKKPVLATLFDPLSWVQELSTPMDPDFPQDEISALCDIAMDGDRGIIERLGCLKFDLPKTIANGDDVCQIRITRK